MEVLKNLKFDMYRWLKKSDEKEIENIEGKNNRELN